MIPKPRQTCLNELKAHLQRSGSSSLNRGHYSLVQVDQVSYFSLFSQSGRFILQAQFKACSHRASQADGPSGTTLIIQSRLFEQSWRRKFTGLFMTALLLTWCSTSSLFWWPVFGMLIVIICCLFLVSVKPTMSTSMRIISVLLRWEICVWQQVELLLLRLLTSTCKQNASHDDEEQKNLDLCPQRIYFLVPHAQSE